MKSHVSTTAITAIFSIMAALATATTATARPTDFSEVSLWVRARETDGSIVREVSHRKLARALTPQQEATLKSQGASDSLVQSLRSPSVIATPAEVAASEVKSQAPRTPLSREAASDSAVDSLQIFEVAAGHPINLSEWGGPDYEFAFNVWRFAGEDVVDTAVVDPVRTYTDVATYMGPGFRTTHPGFRNKRFTPYLTGDMQDDFSIIGGYTTTVSHSTSRGMSIDKGNPVFIKGVPYPLYPIYGVRGVSLYYIGHTSNSVKLAVDTSGR